VVFGRRAAMIAACFGWGVVGWGGGLGVGVGGRCSVWVRGPGVSVAYGWVGVVCPGCVIARGLGQGLGAWFSDMLFMCFGAWSVEVVVVCLLLVGFGRGWGECCGMQGRVVGRVD